MITNNATVLRMSETVLITIHHLEITSVGQFRPSLKSDPDFEIRQAELSSPDFSRFLYATVGSRWKWYERLSWTREQWLAYLDRPEQETWVGYLRGTPVGYFELVYQAGDSVEIVYFGLIPNFIGRGLGGILLSSAVQRAWDIGARRVWLHTCSLDHEVALDNYQARGFHVFKIEQKDVAIPEPPSIVPVLSPQIASLQG